MKKLQICNMIETLCGNHNVYRDILNWLQAFEYREHISHKSCVFVMGDACIGKTYSINKICEHLDLSVYEIDSHNCYDSSQLKDMIVKASTSNLLQNLENTQKKKVIIIDNFEALCFADRSIKTSLLKIIDSINVKNIPIICICSKQIGNICDAKKLCIFELHKPTHDEIQTLLKLLKIKPTKIKELLQNTDGCVSRIFELLNQKVVMNYSSSDPYYDMTYLYSSNTYDRNIIYTIVETDVLQIPLRYHENLISEFANRTVHISKMNRIYADFLQALCMYDLFMYKNNSEIAISIFTSSTYNIMMLKRKKKNISSINKFTKILSYLSLQKKQQKYSYKSSFPFYQLGNYHIHLLDRKFIYFN